MGKRKIYSSELPDSDYLRKKLQERCIAARRLLLLISRCDGVSEEYIFKSQKAVRELEETLETSRKKRSYLLGLIHKVESFVLRRKFTNILLTSLQGNYRKSRLSRKERYRLTLPHLEFADGRFGTVFSLPDFLEGLPQSDIDTIALEVEYLQVDEYGTLIPVSRWFRSSKPGFPRFLSPRYTRLATDVGRSSTSFSIPFLTKMVSVFPRQLIEEVSDSLDRLTESERRKSLTDEENVRAQALQQKHAQLVALLAQLSDLAALSAEEESIRAEEDTVARVGIQQSRL